MALKCTNLGECIQAVMAETIMTDWRSNKTFHALLDQRLKDLSEDEIVEKEYTEEMRKMDLSIPLEKPEIEIGNIHTIDEMREKEERAVAKRFEGL